MVKLIRIELIKLVGYGVFRAIVLLHGALFLLVALIGSHLNLNLEGINVERLFQFPHVWNTLAWVASWFNLLLGILVIILISNEFQFRTFRKQLIDGLSRSELLRAKLFTIAGLSAYTMLLVFLAGLGFGLAHSAELGLLGIARGLHLLPVLYLQAMAYMLLAMLVAFAFGSTALSIISYLLLFFPIGPILRALLPSPADTYLPIRVIANLTPPPDFVGIALGDLIVQPGHGPGPGLGSADASPSLLLAAALALGYSMVFLFVSRHLVRTRNF